MSSLIAEVHLVDGGLMEIPVDQGFLDKLKQLQKSGLQGKALVNELIGDDWGTPPLVVVIKGLAPDGSLVDLRIPYN
jgi:hypothetical protein